jgi:hypothetical protein
LELNNNHSLNPHKIRTFRDCFGSTHFSCSVHCYQSCLWYRLCQRSGRSKSNKWMYMSIKHKSIMIHQLTLTVTKFFFRNDISIVSCYPQNGCSFDRFSLCNMQEISLGIIWGGIIFFCCGSDFRSKKKEVIKCKTVH